MLTTPREFNFSRACCALAIGLIASNAYAMPINYGDFVGTTVVYEQVQEDSGTDPAPLYGAPSISANVLDFDPQAFNSEATGGGADSTIAELNYTISAIAGYMLQDINITEGGDYSLLGDVPGIVGYGISLRVTVLEVGGIPVAPFDINASNSSSETLPGDSGISSPWNLSLNLDLSGQNITKAEISLNDTLLAVGGLTTVAVISKENFTINTTTAVIPEPATLSLVALGFVGMLMRRRVS